MLNKIVTGMGVLLLFVGIFAERKAASGTVPIALDENNWQKMLNGEWMVEFYAPWCPACKNLAPTWDRFAIAAKNFGVQVAVIDVTTSPSLSGRFFVTAMPTIYHVKNGEFRQYRGSRDGDALSSYIELQQWKKTEPLSAWKRPDTVHMSILSYFFKLSHALKDFNAQLQEEYGLPTWGSYALFAIGTIFVGAALGLLLVCIVDFVFPPKKTHRQSFSEAKKKLNEGAVEDIVNDEIVDDIEDEQTVKYGVENDEQEDEEDDDEGELENEDEDDNAVSTTTDGEKNSNSESDAEKTIKTVGVKATDAAATAAIINAAVTAQKRDDKKTTTNVPKTKQGQGTTPPPKVSPSEVRKRKPRKD